MLSKNRLLSMSDDMNDFWNEIPTPTEASKELFGIPNNTPEDSPRQSHQNSAGKQRNFMNIEFHNQLLKALLNKFPENISPKSEIRTGWISVPNNVPRITFSPESKSPIDKNGSGLSVENLESYDLLYVSRKTGDCESDLNGSCSDRFSTVANCASDRSSPCSLSDMDRSFSDEDIYARAHSASLDDLEYSQSVKNLGLTIGTESLKKALSMDDLLENSKRIDCKVTL